MIISTSVKGTYHHSLKLNFLGDLAAHTRNEHPLNRRHRHLQDVDDPQAHVKALPALDLLIKDGVPIRDRRHLHDYGTRRLQPVAGELWDAKPVVRRLGDAVYLCPVPVEYRYRQRHHRISDVRILDIVLEPGVLSRHYLTGTAQRPCLRRNIDPLEHYKRIQRIRSG